MNKELKKLYELQQEIKENVQDLIATHDTGAANGEGIKLYERTTLADLKDRVNLFKDYLIEMNETLSNHYKDQLNQWVKLQNQLDQIKKLVMKEK